MERGEVIEDLAYRLYPGLQEWKERWAFEKGARWADCHQMSPEFDWKDVKTHPKSGTKILIDTISVGILFLKWDKRLFPWNNLVHRYGVFRWMDIDEKELKELDELPF